MKKVVSIITFLFMAVMIIGCAQTSSSRFGADSTGGLTGKTEEEVISRFGKPFKKYTTSDEMKILEYRQAAEEGGAFNKIVAIGSYGMMSGQNSAYVDIMKVYFKKGMVSKATFEEKVQSLTMPGM